MNKRIDRIVQRIWNLSQAFVVPSCNRSGLHQIRTEYMESCWLYHRHQWEKSVFVTQI